MPVFHALLKKEFRALSQAPATWVIWAVMMLGQGFCISSSLKVFQQQALIETVLFTSFNNQFFWFFYFILFPLLTMKLFAEEERLGTMESLLTAPINLSWILISKFLAAYLWYLILWIPSVIAMLIISLTPSLKNVFLFEDVIAVYLLIGIMGVSFVAWGCLCSSLSKHQVLAGIYCLLGLISHHFIGWTSHIWGSFFQASEFLDFLSSRWHIQVASQGLISFDSWFYFISCGVIILMITYYHLNLKRLKR